VSNPLTASRFPASPRYGTQHNATTLAFVSARTNAHRNSPSPRFTTARAAPPRLDTRLHNTAAPTTAPRYSTSHRCNTKHIIPPPGFMATPLHSTRLAIRLHSTAHRIIDVSMLAFISSQLGPCRNVSILGIHYTSNRPTTHHDSPSPRTITQRLTIRLRSNPHRLVTQPGFTSARSRFNPLQIDTRLHLTSTHKHYTSAPGYRSIRLTSNRYSPPQHHGSHRIITRLHLTTSHAVARLHHNALHTPSRRHATTPVFIPNPPDS
jgi:hypothetical protein